MSRFRLDTPPRLNRKGEPVNTPFYALGTTVLFIVAAVVLVLTGNADGKGGATLLAILVSTLPSLVAAGFSERVSRDVRNGTVVEKVRQGTHQALEESGVKDVVEATGRGEATATALAALTTLIQQNEPKMAALAQLLDQKGSGEHDG